MKRLVLILGLLLYAQSAWATIAFVRDGKNSATSGTTIVVTVTLTAGDWAVVCAANDSSLTVSSVTDNASPANSYTKANSVGNGTTHSEVWTASVANAATSVTVTFSGTITRAAVIVGDYSGVSSVGATATNTGSSTSPTVSVTPAVSTNWAVAGIAYARGSNVTYSQNTGHLRDNQSSGATGVTAILNDNTGASPIVNTITASTSDNWAVVGAELKASGGGSAPCANFIALMGAGCK